MTTELDVFKSLQKSVLAAVAASDIPAFPIKVMGITFIKPDDQKWLEIVIIPNDPDNETWDTIRTFRGMMRLILHWPVSGDGIYDPIAFMRSILAYYTKTRLLNSGVKIMNNPSVMSILEEGHENLYPASLTYTCNSG